MSELQSAFKAQVVDHTGEGTLTDGSVLWEVVTGEGERIGDCSTQESAYDLAQALNTALTAWLVADPVDRTTG